MTYVKFDNKNWGYKGDKGTWAAFDINRDGQRVLKVKRAQSGTLSSAYTEELRGFCASHGVDFDSVRCGETKTVVLP